MTGPKPTPNAKLIEAKVKLDAARSRAEKTAESPAETSVANTTDPESRMMKTKTGFIQGYNAQAAVNENQIVIAGAVTQDGNDVRQYQPMVAATQVALRGAGVTDRIGVVLGDAGYWSEDNATSQGPDRLIATLKDHKQRSAARKLGNTTGPAPEGTSSLEAMEHRLRTPEGAALYAKRSHTVEPVFGNHKENHGFRKFRRRGLVAVQAEWALMNISHNISKLFNHHNGIGLATT
jgi:hypothetical protein